MNAGRRLLEPAPLAPPGSLAADFVAGREACLALFPSSALGRGDAGLAARRARLPATAFGTSGPGAARKLERIAAGEGVLVTTGQQPLLFLGPLFVLYKAVRAIETARRIEEEGGIPALACFWIASDDADWDEVSRTALLGADEHPTEFSLAPPPGAEGRPVGPTPLPEAVEPVREAFLGALGESEFVPAWREAVRGAWRTGTPYAAAFASLLAKLLEGRELAWLDSAAPEVRAAALPLMERALRDPQVTAVLGSGTRAVEARGYSPQLTEAEGAVPVFVETGGARERVYRESDELRIGRDAPPRSLREVVTQLAEAPGRFSPSAALRPPLEAWLLPVAVTVLGPGEIGYWAQLGPLFELLGAPMPRIRPRGAWWVVEAKVRKVLEKLEVAPVDLADGGEALTRRIVAEGRPPEVARALERLEGRIDEALSEMTEAVRDHLPGIRSAVGKAGSGFAQAARELERTVDGRVRERQEILLRQVRRAAAHLYPNGKPQERVLSPFEYLARYGPGLIEELEARERELAVTGGGHVAGLAGPA